MGSGKSPAGRHQKSGDSTNGLDSLKNPRTLYFDGREATVYDNPLPLAPDDVIDAYKWGGNDKYEVKSVVAKRVNGMAVGETKEISVKDLGSMQDFVEKDRVKGIMDSGKKPDSIKSQNGSSGISGFRYKGKVYIYDGNHRVVAAMLKGQKKVNVEIDLEITER